MIVYYRLCGIPSTNPSPVFQEDKLRLNKLCLKSFVKAFEKVRPEIVFIADYCGQEYEEMVSLIVPKDWIWSYIPTNLGINDTCLLQYEMASKTDHDVILLQECDYLYRENTGESLMGAIKEFGLVSPYDHPDFYSRYDIHPKDVELKLFNNEHFRISRRNTMTFGMTKEVFERQKERLNKYGYLDNEVWIEMAAHGNYLHTPIPAYATHMTKDFMSPGVDWRSIWEK